MSNPKLNFKEETSAKKTRSPPEKANVEQTQPKKKKLKLDTDKAKEKAQHLRLGKAELTPDDLRRLRKEQKREMYAAALARSAAHREIDQYEEDNVGVQALSEGEKVAGNVQDFSKSRYSRKLKKKAMMQAKKKARTTKSSIRQPDKAQNAGDSNIPHGDSNEGGSNWRSRWKQRQEIRKGYYAAARSGGTAAQTAQRGPEHLFGLAACRADGAERQLQRGVNVWIVEMVKLERGRQLRAAEDQNLGAAREQMLTGCAERGDVMRQVAGLDTGVDDVHLRGLLGGAGR